MKKNGSPQSAAPSVEIGEGTSSESIHLLFSLARSAARLAHASEVFAALVDRSTGGLDRSFSENPNLGCKLEFARLKRCLELHPGMVGALSRDEHALIPIEGDALEVHWNCMQLPNSHPHLLVVPIIHERKLEAVLCMELQSSEAKIAQKIELVREICQRAAPVLAGLRDSEDRSHEDRSAPGSPNMDRCPPEGVVRMKSNLISNVTHELRAPLVAIRGYTNTILQERAGPINRTQGEYLAIVLESANKLVNLINWTGKMLSQAESGLSLAAFDLRELLRECLDQIAAPAAEKNLGISQRVSSNSLVVVGDREALGVALTSLMSLVVNSATPNGSIDVDMHQSKSGQVIFKIAHFGDGIPADVIERVFEKYYDLDTGNTQTASTTERDLARARDSISLHGGTMSVISRVGNGVSFVLTLPGVESADLGERRAS